MQQRFSKASLFNGLLIALLVLAGHRWLALLPDRQPHSAARSAVSFAPVRLDPGQFAPLRLVGAWQVTSPEPRMGGVSALAADGDALIALTDSGVVIRLPRPGSAAGSATFTDLPAGPGGGFYKAGRDSESLARDRGGRGWWVGFETGHSVWLFDGKFRHAVQSVDLMAMGWPANKGAEGAVSTSAGTIIFPESGDELVRVGVGGIERHALANRSRLSDATVLPDGRMLLLARTFGPAGFKSRLLLLDKGRVTPLARLALGRLDNAEAIAAERLPEGATRLWVMTDNDFRRRVPTLLVALDWAP